MSLAQFCRQINPIRARNTLGLLNQHKGELYGKLTFADIDFKSEEFEPLKTTFNHLVVENDRVINGKSTRERRYAKFTCYKNSDRTSFVQHHQLTFKQDVPDDRKKIRHFKAIDPCLFRNEAIKDLMGKMTDMVWEIHPEAKSADMSIHQVRVITHADVEGNNSPEGIHQDGADVIVPAMVFQRSENLSGGISKTYDFDAKTLIDETILKENELNFMQDRKLWHTITKMDIKDKSIEKEYRDILGFDFIVN